MSLPTERVKITEKELKKYKKLQAKGKDWKEAFDKDHPEMISYYCGYGVYSELRLNEKNLSVDFERGSTCD